MCRKFWFSALLMVFTVASAIFIVGCDKKEKVVSGDKKPTVWSIKDNPKLPRVLLIGDSISIGYTIPVRNLLAGEANVHRPLISPTKVLNCASTKEGLKDLDVWLGKKRWDVIHFNWGLHDLKYVDEEGKRVPPEKGRQRVPVDEYEKNLERLVNRLKKTGAKLIFATTTPVPEGALGRLKGDVKRYNAAAVKVMKRNGVVVDDLYSFALPRLEEIQKKQNVHFYENGSQMLAEQVAFSIFGALEEKTGAGESKESNLELKQIKLETSMGDIVIELNEQAAPVTAKNFIRYVKEGFFNGTIFHRVIPNFMIQGGGFTADMRRKGTHKPIINEAGNGLKNSRGTIAMARTANPDSATSQFFINHRDNKNLDYVEGRNPGYAVFGKVVEGMDVVDAIAAVKTTTRSGMRDVPVEPVLIKSAKIISGKSG